MKLCIITLPPGDCVIKLITVIIYGIFVIARVFVPGKPFHPILMFMGKARDLP
jgi:hypothetical protein